MEINLLNVNSVRDFSKGSVTAYVPHKQLNCPETIVNLNVTNAPNGIYMLKIVPATLVNGTQGNYYNLHVNTEFVQVHETDSFETSPGKWTLLINSRTCIVCGVSTVFYCIVNVEEINLTKFSFDHFAMARLQWYGYNIYFCANNRKLRLIQYVFFLFFFDWISFIYLYAINLNSVTRFYSTFANIRSTFEFLENKQMNFKKKHERNIIS